MLVNPRASILCLMDLVPIEDSPSEVSPSVFVSLANSLAESVVAIDFAASRLFRRSKGEKIPRRALNDVSFCALSMAAVVVVYLSLFGDMVLWSDVRCV